MVPAAFRSLRVLRGLNIAGVGLSLAALTSAIFGRLLGGLEHLGLSALVVGLPTLGVGVGWARLLRHRRMIGNTGIRFGWVQSLLLAMLDAAIVAGILVAGGGGGRSLLDRLFGFTIGMALGASVGAVIWVPSLLVVLLLFGVPIAWSQKQAAQGLAGEERGEAVVGAAVTLLSLAVWVSSLLLPHSETYRPSEQWRFLVEPGLCMEIFYAGGGLLAGVLAVALAASRERERRRIVREAEAGRVPGLRVDATDEGKVLVRVPVQGEGYRVSDLDEELFALDQQGRAVQAVPPRAEQSASR